MYLVRVINNKHLDSVENEYSRKIRNIVTVRAGILSCESCQRQCTGNTAYRKCQEVHLIRLSAYI